jgi:mannose-6-phosphate isomerase-like protein (cupin superfamily)
VTLTTVCCAGETDSRHEEESDMFFKYPEDFTRIDYKPGEKAEYVWGEGLLLGRMTINSEPGPSTHTCAQISLVLQGEFDLDIGGETKRLRHGDAIYVPAGVRHEVTKVVAAPVEIMDIWPVSGPDIPA